MIKIGSKIRLNNKLNGTVKYIGDLHNKEGTWIGLELDDSGGRNNGTVDGRKYFDCKEKHGMFIREEVLNSKIHKLSINQENQQSFDKLEDIDYEYKNGVQNIIKESLYTSKIKKLKKELENLKIVNKKTVEDLQEENDILRRKIEQNTNIANKYRTINKKLIENVENFQIEAKNIFNEISDKMKTFKIPKFKIISDESEYLQLCESFKGIILSSIDNNPEELEKNLQVYNEILKNNP
jgi:tubulin-specific chaperone B